MRSSWRGFDGRPHRGDRCRAAFAATPLSRDHRAAYDGARWLLGPEEWAPFFAADEDGRDAFLAARLGDPDPTTAANELSEAIARRERLWRAELITPLDERARALFLLGPPVDRVVPDCAETYRPLEIWRYATGSLAFLAPEPWRGYRQWTPALGRKALYTPRMAAWMDDAGDVEQQGGPKLRIDRMLCPQAEAIDAALSDAARGAIELAPPPDLSAWAAQALARPAVEPPAPASLGASDLAVSFPASRGQRIVTRFTIALHAPEGLGRASLESEDPTVRREVHKLAVDGVVEKGDEIFEVFRTRFEVKPPAPGTPLALVVERPLRPAADYVVRLRVRDEVGQGETRLAADVVVPAVPEAVVEVAVPEEAMAELAADLSRRALPGGDGLVLVPPEDDVVLGLWRAEALVSGERIRKVVFTVDGRPQVTRAAPPWTAELRLSALPRETAVRAEGFDDQGQSVAADDVVLNQPHGELGVRLVEPLPGRRAAPGERIRVRAEMVVPDGRRVERVEFRLDDKVVASAARPPWETSIVVPEGDLVYVSAAAFLDDGRQAEAVRFVRAPANFEAVDVQFVELYTSVVDRDVRPVPDLAERDFAVLEDGRQQRLERFGRVDDLPLTLGLVIDISGSMAASLGEARAAAVGFLREPGRVPATAASRSPSPTGRPS